MKASGVEQERNLLDGANSCEVHLVDDFPSVGNPVLQPSHVVGDIGTFSGYHYLLTAYLGYEKQSSPQTCACCRSIWESGRSPSPSAALA